MNELNFTTTLKELPVVIDGEPYHLRELDGTNKGKFLNGMGQRIVLGPNGAVQGFRDYAGFESMLLALCLYDDSRNLVPAATMAHWPSSMLGQLFEAAQDLSGLTEIGRKRQEAEAKNS